MTKLSKEQILTLHSMAIKQSGGLDGVRDNGLLDMDLLMEIKESVSWLCWFLWMLIN